MTAFALLAACAQPGNPGVAVKTLQSNIVFGVKDKTPDVVTPTPDGTQIAAGGNLGSAAGGATADFTEPAVKQKTKPVSPVKPQETCKQASANSFPAKAASLSVDGPPEVGFYRWKQIVHQSINGKDFPVTSFFQHQISNVSPVTETANPQTPNTPTRTFTYDDSVTLAQASFTSTYRVTTNAPQVNSDQNVGQLVTAGGPDRGVSLVKQVFKDGKGKVGTFNPSTPVLLLPLDVVVPSSFQSVGVDPTGATFENDAQVVSKDAIDACGDEVAGWKLTSTQTFSTSQGQSVQNVTYDIATQLGGILIYQASQPPDQAKAALTELPITVQLAQLKPDPTSTGP